MKNCIHDFSKTVLLIVFLLSVNIIQAQLPKIVFAPQWLPQAQFAGYYVAQEKGFYKDAGIEVEIVPPSANEQATSMLVSRKADVISLFLITALAAKNQGLDVVNIGQISQHSAIMFVAKKSSGIATLSQLNGKKVGIWKSGFDEISKAMIAGQNIKVEWIPILSTVNLFMMDGIDAMAVMKYNEYDQIINSGLNEDELTTFPAASYGCDVPEDGIYCLKSTYENKKPELEKFLQATLKGWEFAANNREYAIDVVLKRMKIAHQPTNMVHQQWMLDNVLDLMKPGNKGVSAGELKKGDFMKASEILGESENIQQKYVFTDFYKPLLK